MNGEITYFNKFLRSEVFEKNKKFDRFIIGGFGTPGRAIQHSNHNGTFIAFEYSDQSFTCRSMSKFISKIFFLFWKTQSSKIELWPWPNDPWPLRNDNFELETDNCNVNIWPIGDKLFAFTETSLIREVDPITLGETSLRKSKLAFIISN